MKPRRLLTIGRSYAVGVNRALAEGIQRAGGGRWSVHVAAPEFVHGDLRPVPFEPPPAGAACEATAVSTIARRSPHLMLYGRRLKAMLRESWDAVYLWEEPYVLSGLQVARWAKSSRFVFYTFQNISKRYPPPFEWIERATVARSAGWVAAGDRVAETLLPRPGYSDRPHRVIGLGVDTKLFSPDRASGAAVRRKLGWADDGPPVVGFLGRFIEAKGLRLLTAALDSLRSDWRALFVGGGPMESELRAWASSRQDGVRIVTGVPHEEVPAYLNAMDMMAAPSQTTPKWREQFGRMLIEAMACGVPVVGSDSGEIPNVLAGAGPALPEADCQRWAEAIDGLLQSEEQRRRLSDAGLNRARTVFDWSVVGGRYVDFFDELCES